MTSDDQNPSRSSKHRRNSDDESEETSKRHKHRHHHHRRHRHHRSRKHEEGETKENTETEEVPQPPPLETTAVVVPNGNWQPDYDMEEGEIVDDEYEVGVDRNNELNTSDKMTEGVQVAVEDASVYVEDQIGKVSSSPIMMGEGKTDDGLIGNARVVRKGESIVDTEIYDGVHLQRNSSVDNNHVNGYIVKDENSKHLKSSCHDVLTKGKGNMDVEHVSRGHSKSETSTKRHDSFEYSPSQERHNEKHRNTNRSRSRDQGREKSRSQSIIQEFSLLRTHEDTAYDAKQTIDSDGETVSKHCRDYRHASRDYSRDKERERSASYNRHNVRVDHRVRETSVYDREKSLEERKSARDRDRDRDREKERERNRERERERKRDRDKERERDRDEDRDRMRDGDIDRQRERRDRVREEEGDKGSRRRKNYDIDIGYSDRDRHNDHRHQRPDDKEYSDRSRKSDKEKIDSYKTDHSERDSEKLRRDEVEQEDYQEPVVVGLAEQEEEDLHRIKEESRRRRQAILEKYKTQQSQQKHELKSEGTDKVSAVQPSVPIEETHSGQNDSADMFLNDASFPLGKSPEQTEPPTLKIPGTGTLGEGTPKSERSDDMFCDDIFGDSPAGVRKQGKGDGLKIERSGLHDNWDDAEGYYSYRFGEVLDGRYEVIAAHGKGVYSNVVCAKDLKAGSSDPEKVAIKIIRSNDTMYKAGLEELVILKKLVGADQEDRRHCVRFLSSFKYRNHLCLVFESLHMNLREVLKKFGRNIGLKLTAVRTYAKQLFIALKHLKNCGVLHSDIKPDNMLVNETKNVLKLSDFGNAMFAGKNEITPYLVSRFYRAPEIILGLPYDHPMDIWSVGCCLYELYTGKVIFPGPSNNDMLRLHMELKGPFPKKMLRKGAFTDQHFDQDLNFLATEEDPVTKKAIRRLTLNIKPKDISTIISGSAGEDPKMLANFKDLLEKIFVLDPDRRITVSQALSHPFIMGK